MADAVKRSASNHNTLGAACYRCRGFRHACDRTKPSCSRCKRRGTICTYPEAAPTLKKLQKATETLGERIKKFGELLKTNEGSNLVKTQGDTPKATEDTNSKGKDFKGISLQKLAQPRSSITLTLDSISSPSLEDDTRSSLSGPSDREYGMEDVQSTSSSSGSHLPAGVASTSSFSIYPCGKCYKDLQQCDLTLPSCSRCTAHKLECVYHKTEPKANHVSQVLNTMNKVMDQWQESIDKMAKDFAQKTRDFGQLVDQSLKKPLQPFAWKITTTNKGLSVESNVNSFNDLSKLVDQFKKVMHISPRDGPDTMNEGLDVESHRLSFHGELDDNSSINTSSSFSFGVWNSWLHPVNTLPEDYPIDISQELTDSLVELYCKTPCCSSIRLPIIDTSDFLERYCHPEIDKRPPLILTYAICAMAARTSFQIHVWNKNPEHLVGHYYNMGKALSIAYCLKGREKLGDCFDQPSIDNCRAVFLLSYCNQQNGYPGAIYIYEWIAFTMAEELGLYDEDRVLTIQESTLVWYLYYFNTWYRVLHGVSDESIEGSQLPFSPLPAPPVKPAISHPNPSELSQELIDYYIYSEWYYLIQLQLLRHEVMTRLLSAQSLGKTDTTLSQDMFMMQDKLNYFYNNLPEEWKNPDIDSLAFHQKTHTPDSSSFSCHDKEKSFYHLDAQEFPRFCILTVHVYYNINKILLYQAFFPSDHYPVSSISLHFLQICIDAAYSITQTLDVMVKYHAESNIPLLGFLFANIVYLKLLNYTDGRYKEFAIRCLEQSINITKLSKSYLYDYEMARNLVSTMEKDVYNACKGRPPDMLDINIYTPY
ncbi:hypothetical protein BDB01DRAFT_804650 [Pilobolus umbonatus]|nr:hypothetical protein BDB01DRAFT_804650 [Pilobolus umbonatus]